MKRWIGNPRGEFVLILMPPFVSVLVAFWLSGQDPMNAVSWLLLIVCVDVAHVYSTVFRTYLDQNERRTRGLLLTLIPLACAICGMVLFQASELVFWRVLAYVAAFHFVRQQYGFMRIYARLEAPSPLDAIAIYAAALFPLVYWHTHERNFHWFVANDFFQFRSEWIAMAAGVIYSAILGVYVWKEIKNLQAHNFNWQKNLILLGTMLSWSVGIVVLDSDISFTITNVISHGIPYMALVWIYGNKEGKPAFKPGLIPIVVVTLVALAFFEESIWDALIWKEHQDLFPFLAYLYSWQLKTETRSIVIPILAVPQATHYVLDAFIWKLHGDSTSWRSVIQLG